MNRIRQKHLCCMEGRTEMITEKDTLLTHLKREMREAPMSAPSPRKAEKRFLADGYERLTDEETLQMTEKYRHRKMRTVLRVLLTTVFVSLIVVAILKAGIISI